MYGANGAGVRIGPLVAHDSHRHHRQEHRERLPDFSVETSLLDFANHDVVAVAQDGEPLGCDLAQNSHGESGSGKRLALKNLLWHAEVAADLADFVLKQIL